VNCLSSIILPERSIVETTETRREGWPTSQAVRISK
jgi:hypothetical protein